MLIDAGLVAEKLSEYIYHAIQIEDLNRWANHALATGDFRGDDDILGNVKRMCGPLTWDDCSQIMRRLGYRIRVEVFQDQAREYSGRMRPVPTKRASQRRVTKRLTKPQP